MRLHPLLLALSLFASCDHEKSSSNAIPLPNSKAAKKTLTAIPVKMSEAEYKDRILGALVGSTIGDAMGSPVEMWSSEQIAQRYGFIDHLIPNIRPASAEGAWQSNMIAGTGTDDTRWKVFVGNYLLELKPQTLPTDVSFAAYVLKQYDLLQANLLEQDGFLPEQLEASTRYLQWLQEWAKVANAYQSQEVSTYATALSKFYGGEMSCAGMLYAPLLGILFPEDPVAAYHSAWELSFFDIGYAKDITAMTAALSAAAFDKNASAEQLLAIHYEADEQSFAESRLIGRIANSIYENALRDNKAARNTDNLTVEFDHLPEYFNGDSLRYQQLLLLYSKMNAQLQNIAFHANEIYMISLYAILYAEGNFMDAMCFITNFGRDNDTVGAVVGTILGIQQGYSGLPPKLAQQVIEAQKEILNIDLEQLAAQLCQNFYQQEWKEK